MKYPTLPVPSTSREMLDVFLGYDHNLRIGENAFFDMKNMTGDYYPILSPRGKRGVYAAPQAAQGLIAKDTLCYVDGADFVMDGYRINMGLSQKPEDCPKQLISMGAYVIILPDKMYINTLDVTDFGRIEAAFESSADVTFELCTMDGEEYTGVTVSAQEPEDPDNLAYWIDTGSTPHTLKQYSASAGMWVSIATTYIRITSAGIGKAFERYDGVTISGVRSEQLQDLNANLVIWAKADDYIVVPGILDAVVTQAAAEGAISVKRSMPWMDFVIESENRLWGCRYGVAANGEVVNEIYASKLGDFKNWNCFMGLSTDSYVASVGTDGQFTGAITHLGYPLFWKEGCVHKVYGNYPANFQIQTTACRGVQRGCDRSLAIVGEVLYYKARQAVCAYDGSLPVEVSAALGQESYSRAVAGSHGSKYYISMADSAQDYHLFVYDAAKGLWHKEDGLRCLAFCDCRGELYCIDADTGKILTMLGSGTQDREMVEWMAQTGIIGVDLPDRKRLTRLLLRLSMEIGARMRIFAQYDSVGAWEPLGTISGTSLRTFQIPVRPRRCDHLRLRLEGVGDVKIYAITKTMEQGSDTA